MIFVNGVLLHVFVGGQTDAEDDGVTFLSAVAADFSGLMRHWVGHGH